MTVSSQFAAQKNCRGSQCEDEEEEASSSFEKATKKINKDSGSRRFFASIIGLPKRPDTKFRKADFSARIRSSISRKCRRSTAPLFSVVPREAMSNSKGSGNSFKIYDPGSPDVSCLGRIKLKQKDGVKLKAIASKGREGRCPWGSEVGSRSTQSEGRLSWIKKLFSFSSKRKIQVQVHGSNRTPASHEFPSQNESFSPRLSYTHVTQLKRFSLDNVPFTSYKILYFNGIVASRAKNKGMDRKDESMFIFMIVITVVGAAQGATRVGFYSSTCPNVESLVRSSVQFFIDSDATLAPALVRMHFHDCFVQGCDASVLVEGLSTEKTAGGNTGLRGFEVIMDAKARMEGVCPGVVSCADILALAARDAVVLSDGPSWDVPLGRLDGRRSLASDVANIPSPTDSLALLIQKFAERGLTTRDLVALSGGHTIGQADCQFFSYRLYNYKATGMADPTINSMSLRQLQDICPRNGNDNGRAAALDKGSRNRWDNSYFQNILAGNAVLESDQELAADPFTRSLVNTFATSADSFDDAFTKSMVKLANVGVKTRADGGEIRRMCSVINF